MEDRGKGFFWPSYVDLLTALFAVVLVLFVLSFKLFGDQTRNLEVQQEKSKAKDSAAQVKAAEYKVKDSIAQVKEAAYKVMKEQYEQITNLEAQKKAMQTTGIFKYDSVHMRYLVEGLSGKPIFEEGKFRMYDTYKPIAKQAGLAIMNMVNNNTNKNISFLVLIESNTAKEYDGKPKGTIDGNYELSYKRSLALLKFWEDEGIRFNDQTEVIIAGSGVKGVGREEGPAMEENNRRFLIQVIPKIKS